MKESIKQRRKDEKLALLLDISLEEVQALRAKEEADDQVREAQAIHLFLEKPSAFIQKICKECKAPFLTTYTYVTNCSSPCRIKSLERVGIAWNPMHNPVERWQRAKIPTGYTIPPQALEILLTIAQEQQLAQQKADCETDEQHEEIQHTQQLNNESHKDLDESLLESMTIEVPAFLLE